jgi:ADP-heptose:LPS heptosyltransferase
MNKQTSFEADRAAQQFMQHHQEGQFAVDALDFIINLAVSNDLEKARVGTNVFFGHVIEPLSDTFLVQDRKTLQKVLAYLIIRIRALPQAKQLHEKLDQWGLKDETGLLNRMERLSSPKTFADGSVGKIKKIFVPSRVTLGADVLLNIPVIEKMKKRFPDAEIVFLGSEKNGSILKGSQAMVRVHTLQYKRRGVLLNRFLIWLDVIRAMEEETAALEQEEDFIIINTDSRLLQSGLLPIISPGKEDKRYFFWAPSVNHEEWTGTSQAEDLLQWLDSTFGKEPGGERIYPKIHFPTEDKNFADKVYRVLNPEGNRFVVSMSWGVGGNEAKRELAFILKLLSDGVIVILDRGYGREEFEQAEAIIGAVRAKGFEVAEFTGENPVSIDESKSRDIRFAAFQGTVNKFAALIGVSDLYIGYDSLGQHLAAAVDRDVIAIFAGYGTDLFPERWKPLGKGTICLVKARCGPFTLKRQDELAAHVFQLYKSMERQS